MAGFTVYLHTFPNGKKYIGITSQPLNRRWRNGDGYLGQPVYYAILKYGWINIKHDILFTGLTKEQAETKEQELIKELNTNSHKHGYNVEAGGNASKVSESTKEKLSKIKKDYYKTHKHYNTGKHLSQETRLKIAKSRTGQKQSEDTKAKLSELNRGSNNRMFGVKMTSEQKNKLQTACVKATSKPCICVETGKRYNSIAEASRETGVCARTIAYVCNKQNYNTAGGYHWKYEEVV